MLRYEFDENFRERFKENWNTQIHSMRVTGFVIGILMAVLGVVCLIFPVQSVFVVEVIASLAIMIFGNWNPLNIAGASLLFGLFKCIAAVYSTLDINGDGVYALANLGISAHFYRLLPYLITLIVLAFTSKQSRAPKAEGIPYEKGQR